MSRAPLKLSVVICTRNRAGPLERVLASLTNLDPLVGADWELIVVDNGSTDTTPDVLAKFAGTLPIRSVLEPRAGLSFARNAGVGAASGDYIVWTDDDVTVDGQWLSGYLAAFRAFPNAVVFGGAVTPVLEPPSPSWLIANRKALRYLLAEVDPPATCERFDASASQLPYGANFAVRAAEQRRHLYDVELGASPLFNRLGEEEQVILAVLGEGGEGRWAPSSKVRHHIPSERQTLGYVEKYSRASGETWSFLQIKTGAIDPRRPPRWIRRNVLVDFVLYRLLKPIAPSRVWLPRLASYAYCSAAARYLAQQGAKRAT